MNEFGRYGDTEIAHVAPGEMVLPQDVLRGNPELFEMILQALQQAGMDPARYMVSSGENSINPMTGAQEFYGSDAERGFEDAQGQFGGAQGNEPGYGDGRHSTGGGSGGGGAGINAVDVQAAAKAGKSYGGISAPDLSKAFPDLFETPDTGGMGPGGAGGVAEYGGTRSAGDNDFGGFSGGDREGVPDPSADPRGTLAQRGLYNSGAGKGGIPDKDFMDEVLSFFGINKRYDPLKDPLTGKTKPYQYDKHWGLDINPVGTAASMALGPIGLLAGPVIGKAATAVGVPSVGVDKNGVSWDGEPLAGWDPSPGSPFSDDGGPDPYSPQEQTQINEIMRAFSPPPVAEMPSWLTFPTAMNDRQKRSYLTTNALYGGNSNFRSDETYDLWKSLFQNNAYSDTGELRALSDLLQQTERTYLTNNRGQTVPSTTQQLLNIL